MTSERDSLPEFAPIRDYVKSLTIVVTIYDKADKPIRVERMDYGKADDRKWLGKLSYWAWTNGHTVETRVEQV